MAKTALELSPLEWRAYHPAKIIEKRHQQQQVLREVRQQQAWGLVRQVAQRLRHEFLAKRIVLFGSLAHGAWFTRWSDIDLAVWGIPPEQFFMAVVAITDLSPDFKIDLVNPESCSPTLLRIIEQKGIEL
jgi:predicted nucleotidyltransferase